MQFCSKFASCHFADCRKTKLKFADRYNDGGIVNRKSDNWRQNYSDHFREREAHFTDSAPGTAISPGYATKTATNKLCSLRFLLLIRMLVVPTTSAAELKQSVASVCLSVRPFVSTLSLF